jgi:hypothetical protein
VSPSAGPPADRKQGNLNICSEIQDCQKIHTLLRLSFNNQGLWLTPYKADDRSSMLLPDGQAAFEAFEVLFQKGGLEGTGQLEIVKKSKLALRLALSLESLCVGPWLQEPWTVGSVQIPSDPDKTPTERLDHAYISCVLASHHRQAGLLPDIPQDTIPEKRKLYLLSFAQFLVDIKKGKKGHWPCAGEPLDAWYDTLCKEVTNRPSREAEVDLWNDYQKAIESCLLYPRIYQAEPRGDTPDDRKLIQDIISKHIVLPLQHHLERWTVDEGGSSFPPPDPDRLASTDTLTHGDSISEFTLWGEAEDNFKVVYVDSLMAA